MIHSKKVAAVQMVSTADIHANIAAAGRLIEQAVEAGAGLIVLPENFAVLDGGPLAAHAERQGEPGLLQDFLSAQAAGHHCYIVGGTIPMLDRPGLSGSSHSQLTDGRVRPACLVYGPEGSVIARYDKIHLFDVDVQDEHSRYRESESFEAGDEVVVVDTSIARVGLSICYDLRFPELYRRLFAQQAELITVPAAFTRVTGEAHWEPLLRARAIENQSYVVAAGQGGVHSRTRETWGHSMIIDPWGTVLACVERGEGIAVAEVDIFKLHDLRRSMPVASHRKL